MKKTTVLRNDLQKWNEYIPVLSAERIALDQEREIETITKLDAGESVYGPSPRVQKYLSEFKGYQYYPDSSYSALRKEIGKYVGVSSRNIFITNGADELIDLTLRLILNPGEEVINCSPTFSSYTISTILNRGVIKEVVRNKDYSLNGELINRSITKKTKIVFICNPNNPTGTVSTLQEIKKILRTGVLVCVDEAYIEFGGITALPLLNTYPNLIIIRSLSKWAGIAGLRLGYGIMSEYLVNNLMKIKAPYNVNYAAVIAGIASLEDKKYRDSVIRKIIKGREWIENEIKKLGRYTLFESQGNFIFLIAAQDQIGRIKNECGLRNIALRFFQSSLVNNAIRITVGTMKQNRQVISILKQCI